MTLCSIHHTYLSSPCLTVRSVHRHTEAATRLLRVRRADEEDAGTTEFLQQTISNYFNVYDVSVHHGRT